MRLRGAEQSSANLSKICLGSPFGLGGARFSPKAVKANTTAQSDYTHRVVRIGHNKISRFRTAKDRRSIAAPFKQKPKIEEQF
jgi:hypothetical protein